MAGVVGLWAFYRLPELGMLRAVGISFLAVVLLGPSLQPWYLVWGIVILAATYGPRIATGIVWLTIVVSFLGLVGLNLLTTELGSLGPSLEFLLLAVLVASAIAPIATYPVPKKPHPPRQVRIFSRSGFSDRTAVSWRPTGSGGRPDLEWARISGRFGSRTLVLLEVVREHTGNGGSTTEPGSGKQP